MKRTYQVSVNDKEFDVTLLSKSGDVVTFEVNGNPYTVSVEPKLLRAAVQSETSTNTKRVGGPKIVRTEQPVVQMESGAIQSPLPGIVAKLLVKKGDEVSVGQPVIIIEAMKMENVIASNFSAAIKEVLVAEGEEVKKGQVLLKSA